MRLVCAAISTVVLSLFVFAHMALAAPQNEACSLPQDLKGVISSNYRGAKLVTISDLDEYDRGLFQKDHGKSCPGLGEGRFLWRQEAYSGFGFDHRRRR